MKQRPAPADGLPDAEAALAALAERMRGAIAFDAAFVGIYSGGAWLAERLAAMLPGNHPVGFIDVSFYRDDYSRTGLKPNPRRTELPFDVAGATIVLVDDVLYTGRSVRAAVNELFDFGRPDRIELAVLVDRGGRELPVEATYVGGAARCGASDAVDRAVARRRRASLALVDRIRGRRREHAVQPADQGRRLARASADARRACPPTIIVRILDTAEFPSRRSPSAT